MELRHLRYFLAAAEHEHFRRASEALHVSQPTLSLQIQQLEEELGTPLFERVGRGVRLTQAGVLFRDHARRTLRDLDEARAALDDLGQLRRGRLTVGVLQTVNAGLMPQAIASFSAAYPGVTLRVDELPADDIEAGVEAGGLDLGVSFAPAADSPLAHEALFDEELVLVVRHDHRFAARTRVPVSALAAEPLMLLPRGYCTRRVVDDTFQQAGTRPTVAVEMNTIAALLATLRHGGPATILPLLAVPPNDVACRVVRLVRPTPTRTVAVVTRRTGPHTMAAARFTAILQDVAVANQASTT